jgi:hypothetical protein
LIDCIDELANFHSRNFPIFAQTLKCVFDEIDDFIGLESPTFVSIVLLENSINGFEQLAIGGFVIHYSELLNRNIIN